MAGTRPGIGTRIGLRVLPFLFAWAIRLFYATYRKRVVDAGRAARFAEAARGGRAVFAVWHQRGLPFLSVMRGTPAVILVSLSTDGELIARTMQKLGLGTVRGSSSRRAGAGLLGMVNRIRDGGSGCFLADGPKGPARVAKLGPVAAARDAGAAAVWPVACAVRPAVTLRSWDRFRIPLPFARVVFAYGDPVPVPPDADRDGLERCREALEAALNACTADADRALGVLPPVAPAPAPAGGVA